MEKLREYFHMKSEDSKFHKVINKAHILVTPLYMEKLMGL